MSAPPVWGIADLHTHPMAHLGFGGAVFWGHPDGAMETALGCCTPGHGLGGTGLGGAARNILMTFFEDPGSGSLLGHGVMGGSGFEHWPRFTTTIHQQMYVDWIKRAHEGGLRLIVAFALNNQLLADEFGGRAPFDDRTSVEIQIKAMKELVSRHSGWMEIALSAADARRIAGEGKLCVVLGVEVDSLGNFRREDGCSEEEVHDYLEHLHGIGVRHLFPIHLTNNAFGGAAIYMDLFAVLNRHVNGDYFQVEDAAADGVQFRLGEGEGPPVQWYRSPVGLCPPSLGAYYDPPDYPAGGGHANALGLTARGEFLIEEMMRLGMIVDVDHMSQKAVNRTLAIAEREGYPVVSGHTAFRELALDAEETANVHKRASERQLTAAQVERIRRLGGMIAPILNVGDIRGWGDHVPNDCCGSSKSWAQAYSYAVEKMGGRGVGLGSDFNGFNQLPAPRFGFNAGYSLHARPQKDPRRLPQRAAQVAAQTNGVRYGTPMADFRGYRFEGVLAGEIYDDEDREIAQAVAVFRAGRDPWTEDIAGIGDDAAHYARGFHATSDEQLLRPGLLTGRDPWRQRAAYLVKTGQRPTPGSERDPEPVHRLHPKVLAMWERWHAMDGSNAPMTRSQAGQRDFDINIDGVAHIGMLPDFVQDLKNVGMPDQSLDPLFRSVEDYITVWEKCERHRR